MTMLEQREGGCHCGRVRFQARVDLDLLSQCNCSICTKKGILHLPIAVDDFELLRGKNALTVYTLVDVGTPVPHTMFKLAFDERQPNRVSCATNGGQVWTSRHGGERW